MTSHSVPTPKLRILNCHTLF